MGDGKKGALRVALDKRFKLEFHGAEITSDGGLSLYRELDEALGLTELDKAVLEDTRTGKNTQHKMAPLLAEVAVPRELFAAILKRTSRVRRLPGVG